LRNIGQDLGGAVKGFKDGMKTSEESKDPSNEQIPQSSATAEKTVDVHAKDVK